MTSGGSDSFRVLLVISELSSGGAPRDLVRLAVGLKNRGHRVEVLVYWPGDFFAETLAKAGICVTRLRARNPLHLVLAMRRAIRNGRPDVVAAFTPGPSLLAELAGLPRRDHAVVSVELGLDSAYRRPWQWIKCMLHRLADAVVCNSHAQRQRIAEQAPKLKDRTHLIVNGMDLKRFPVRGAIAAPGRHDEDMTDRSGGLRILVLARFHPVKNPFGLLEAMEILRDNHPAVDVVVAWHGEHIGSGDPRAYRWRARFRRKMDDFYKTLEEAVAERSLTERFLMHPEREDVVPLYHAADAVCMPSFSEGMSNVICEAMACGVPLLASRVGDSPRLVVDGRNGFLFDPNSPRDIAETILRFANMPSEARRRMGAEGRRMAEAMPTPDMFADRYIALFETVTARRGRTERPA